MKIILAALVLSAALSGCVVLDVVEGFRQFGGNSPSKYAEWRNRQEERRFEKTRNP
jgi:hypothetical protein